MIHLYDWPLAVGITLLKELSRLPYRWQWLLGNILGYGLQYLLPNRLRIAAINLKLCFPTLTEMERHRLLKAHFAALGIGVFETALAWWSADHDLPTPVEIIGLDHLQQAYQRGRGVILFTGHFTTLELGARFIALHYAFHALQRPHKNAFYNTLMQQLREQRSQLPPLARDDMRGMIRALKKGHIVWYAPDQNYSVKGRSKNNRPTKNYAFVPFFGLPAATVTATARLAQLTAAAVVPYFPKRLAKGSGYRITIQPPLTDFPSGDLVADTQRLNRLLETAIIDAPEQYLWVHRRFKSQLPGQKSFYDF